MSNSDETRWRQRLKSFEKAFAQLEKACEKREYSELERAGLVQMFEFTFELGWKTLKDLLCYEGRDENTPRAAIRGAFEAGYLGEDDAELWLDALNKRNILSHVYEEKFAEEAVALIKDQYAGMLKRALDSLGRKRNGS